jgi:SAM-dependent methyltransferase
VKPDPSSFWTHASARFAETARDPQSFYARRTAFVAEIVSQHAHGRRVLDIGCGAGQLCIALARRDFDVHGADLSRAQIAAAIEGARGVVDDPELRFRVCGRDGLPFAGRFDVITAIGVLPYIEDHATFITHAAERLTPTGLLVVSSTNRASLFTCIAVARHVRSFEPSRHWFAVLTNLLRTGVWSGGFVDLRMARQCRSARTLDRMCRGVSLVPEGSFDLYNVGGGRLDRSALKRGWLGRVIARHCGWTHVGVYRPNSCADVARP